MRLMGDLTECSKLAISFWLMMEFSFPACCLKFASYERREEITVADGQMGKVGWPRTQLQGQLRFLRLRVGQDLTSSRGGVSLST